MFYTKLEPIPDEIIIPYDYPDHLAALLEKLLLDEPKSPPLVSPPDEPLPIPGKDTRGYDHYWKKHVYSNPRHLPNRSAVKQQTMEDNGFQHKDLRRKKRPNRFRMINPK